MRCNPMTPLALVAIAATIGCGGQEAPAPPPAPPQGYVVAPVADGGTITGKVSFQGDPPAAETIEITKDASVCGEKKSRATVRVDGSGGLAGVVVWVDGIEKGKDWGGLSGGLVDQNGCEYSPDIQLVREGDPIEIINSDPLLHNVHGYYKGTETIFNIAQPTQGMRSVKKLAKAGPVHLTCDVHSWMSAWVFVADSPYVTVSAIDGAFAIEGVPPGAHAVKAWHPEFGEKSIDVTVTAGGETAAGVSMP